MLKILECSLRGDKRYSAFYAKVAVNGVVKSIEEHYQLSKVFSDNGKLITYNNVRDAKGKKPCAFIVNNKLYDIKYLSMWYKLLWVKYLDKHPELVAYASTFDDFNDMFKGKNTVNCQADVIRQYVKCGRNSIMKECMPLINLMKK
jgi:hypothetical protein